MCACAPRRPGSPCGALGLAGGREMLSAQRARCPCRARERGRVAGASAVLGPTLLLPSNSLINEFDFFSNTIEVVTVFLLTTCNILMVIPSFNSRWVRLRGRAAVTTGYRGHILCVCTGRILRPVAGGDGQFPKLFVAPCVGLKIVPTDPQSSPHTSP